MVKIRVRFAETDAMGIVHHSNYLKYFEEARVEWLKTHGMSYRDWMSQGVHLPVIAANIQYKKPARFEDILAIKAVPHREKARIIFSYEVFLEPNNTLIATGETQHVPVDDEMHIVRLPKNWADVIDESAR